MNNLPWIEKYSPKKLDDIVGNKESITRIKTFILSNLPHLIIFGSSGTGKTCITQAIIREYFKGIDYKNMYLDMNASDERGVSTVRNKIRIFVKRKIHLPKNLKRIIILDEADNMTESSQKILTEFMEKDTIFIFVCNNIEKIYENIQSRCIIINLYDISDIDIIKHLEKICIQENIKVNKKGLETLAFICQGDIRQALNNMQSTFTCFGNIECENIYKICDKPHPDIIYDIITLCIDKKVDEACEKVIKLWNNGFTAIDIVKTFFLIIKKINIIPKKKINYIVNIAFTHLRILEEINSPIQLTSMIVKLCNNNNGIDFY